MIYLPNEIFLIIYSYVGHNSLYLNKDYYNYLVRERQKFIEHPIKINYKLIKFKYKSNKSIINKLCTKIKPRIKVLKQKFVKINSNIFLGKVLKNEYEFINEEYEIKPSLDIKKFIIGNKLIMDDKIYLNSNVIYYDVFFMWPDNINHTINYSKLWVK